MILDTAKNRQILLSLHEDIVLLEKDGYLDWDLDWDLYESDEDNSDWVDFYHSEIDFLSKELVYVFDGLDKDAETPVLLVDFRYTGNSHTRFYIVWVPSHGPKRFEFVEGHYSSSGNGKTIPSHWRGEAPPKGWGLAVDWRDDDGSLDRSIFRRIYGSSYGYAISGEIFDLKD